MTPKAPVIDWEALSPLVALTAAPASCCSPGCCGPGSCARHVVPALAVITLAVTAGLGIWQWGVDTEVVERALAIDDLTLSLTMVFCGGGIAAVLLSWRSRAVVEAGEGEYYALLLSSVLGMVILVAAQNLVALFLGFELLSIPLYVLCATHMRREPSLESGLKYLIVGSVGLGDAALRPRVPLRRDGDDRLRGHRRGGDVGRAALHRHRAGRGGSGLQGVGGAVPPVDAGRLRGRADRRSPASWRWPPRRRPSA